MMCTILTTRVLVPAWIVLAGIGGTVLPPPSIHVALACLLLTIVVIPCVAMIVEALVWRRFPSWGS